MMVGALERQPLIGTLAIVAAALVGVIGVETGFGTRLAPSIPAMTVRPAAPFEAKLLPPLEEPNPEQAYPETVARPLFVPLRRPAPAQDAAAQQAMRRGQFVLQGVTIAGDTRIALLKEKSTGHVVRAEKGKEVNGLKVTEVTPESVTLEQGKEQEVLPLQVGKAGPSNVAPNTGPFGPPGVPGVFSAGPAAGAAPGLPAHPLPAPPSSTSNPAAPSVPQASGAPLTPEELLARRRARREQQTQ